MKMLNSLLTIMTLTSMVMIITTTISKKKKISREKNSPFECGFSKLSSPRKSFSTHFFLIATIFLIFDIEISIILPMFSTKMNKMNEWLFSSMIIMMILMVGLIHEWKNGMLEWTN
uniref:NADH dehydrogenase subunit 3 n=1 Tax=Tenguna kuankuoshuiensis TaxID=3054878 RepID=UPI0026E15870|nr:NADH dehydrogenase subunit 3 [Tenguna kuankuoshuiensis]WJE88878.1 NADH dehydrogenase subunit 3 [Tenguna kuankuoshuiensis]